MEYDGKHEEDIAEDDPRIVRIAWLLVDISYSIYGS